MWDKPWARLLYHNMLLSDTEEIEGLEDGFRAIEHAYLANHAFHDGKMLKDDRDRHRNRVRQSMFWVPPDPAERQARMDLARASSAAILAKAGIIVPPRKDG